MEIRTIPSSIAKVVELLELEQPAVVSTAYLNAAAKEVGSDLSGTAIAELLRQRRWLLPLRTRHAWEFVPAARAGAFAGGDPFIELKARQTTGASVPPLAAESAALLLGLASRIPEPHVIALAPTLRLARSLDNFRVVRWVAKTDLVEVDSLFVWSTSTLLAFIGSKPDQYRDWRNVSEWLNQAVGKAAVAHLAAELEGRTRSCWARASYLLDQGGDSAKAGALFDLAPEGTNGPFHLGPRDMPSKYHKKFKVADHVLASSRSVKSL